MPACCDARPLTAATAADRWSLARFHADPFEQAIDVPDNCQPNALKSQAFSNAWQFDFNFLLLAELE
jgi:hypothetical protein